MASVKKDSPDEKGPKWAANIIGLILKTLTWFLCSTSSTVSKNGYFGPFPMRRYHFEKNGRVLSPSIVQENQAKKGSFTAVKGVSFLSIALDVFFSQLMY